MSKIGRENPFSFFDIQPTLPVDYAQSWLKGQARWLAAMQSLTNHWFEHRQRNIDAILTTVGRISACKDAAEIAETQQQWISGASDRLVSEMTGLRDDVVALTQSTASAVIDSFGNGKKAA
jgi:hypothetical protein